MKSQTLPNLASLHRQLAGDVTRVNKFIETLPWHVDHLVEAAIAQDWAEVERQAEYLAGTGEACNLQEISQAAKEVQAAINADNQLLTRRAVLRLIGRCGAVKMPAQDSPAK